MIIQILRFVLVLPLLLVLLFFMIANYHDVSLTISPVHEPVTTSLTLIVLSSFLLGFLTCFIATGLNRLARLFSNKEKRTDHKNNNNLLHQKDTHQ